MKFYARAFSFYMTMVFLSIIFYGCIPCKEQNKQIIDEGLLFVFSDEDRNILEGDTINSAFTFRIELVTDIVEHYRKGGLLINEAHGTQQCPLGILNPIDSTTVIVSTNKNFIFKNTEIPSGQNIKSLDGTRFVIDDYWKSTPYDLYFFMEEEFINNAVFLNEEYTFFIEAQTIDGLSIKHEITLFMDLS